MSATIARPAGSVSSFGSRVLVGAALFVLLACENTVIVPSDEGGGGAGGTGGAPGTGAFLPTGGAPGEGGTGGLGEVIDPECKDQPPPIQDFQCDPSDQNNGQCLFGEGCYIYVQYPDEPCGQEIYGALCLAEGSGSQGDPCGGATDCQAGHACVITGSGTQCVVLCPLDGPSDCPSGLVCEPIDVDGFGGCL